MSRLMDGLQDATRTLLPRAASSSEAAELGGKKALTPIIAGSICGGVLFILWGIGFVLYFRKRWRRKQRNRLIKLGKAEPREKDLEIAKEKIVIPPDPAVLLGQRKAGETAFPERQNSSHNKHRIPPWSRHNSQNKTTPPSLETPPMDTPQISTGSNTVQDSPVESATYMTADEGTTIVGPRRPLP